MGGNRGGPGTSGPTAFADQVRDALAHLYDTVHLQSHALAQLVAARGSPSERDAPAGRGRRLRRDMLDAIEALRSSGEAGVAARRHQALVLRYVDGLDVPAITARLALGRSQYYTDH